MAHGKAFSENISEYDIPNINYNKQKYNYTKKEPDLIKFIQSDFR